MSKVVTRKLDQVAPQIVEAYNNGATLVEIGRAHQCSAGTVSNLLKANGVERRPRGRRKKETVNVNEQAS